jgi:hypothetical protein
MGHIHETNIEYHEEYLSILGEKINLPKKIITRIELYKSSAIHGDIMSKYCYVITEIDHKSAFFGSTKDICSIEIFPENEGFPYHKEIDNDSDLGVEERENINDVWEAIALHLDTCQTLAKH